MASLTSQVTNGASSGQLAFAHVDQQPRSRAAGRLFRQPGLMALLPTTAFLVFVVALLTSGAPAQRPDLRRLLVEVDRWSLGRVLLLSVAALLLAALLRPFQFGLIRLLEGYWDDSAVGRLLAKVGISVHRRRLERLQNVSCAPADTTRERSRQDRALRRLASYPAVDRLLPTRLGNTLRAAEDDAGQRYGLATVTMWPRLYPHLSERLAQVIDDARNQLDLTVRLCVVLAVATLVSAVLLAAHGWWLTVPVVTAVLSWVAYRAAMRAAASYGETLRHAFDLHRFDMLRGLHYPLPADPVQEWAFNQRLSQFYQEGPDDELLGDPYEHPEKDTG